MKKHYKLYSEVFPALSCHFCKSDRMHVQSTQRTFSKNLLKIGACQLLQDKQLDIQKLLPDLEASQRVVENLAFLSLLYGVLFLSIVKQKAGGGGRGGGNPPGIALNKPLIPLTEGTRLFNVMQTIYNLLIANSQRQHFGI